MGSSLGEVVCNPDEGHHSKIIEAFWNANGEITQQLYFNITTQNPSIDKHYLKLIASIMWCETSHFCNQLSQLLDYDPVYDDFGSELFTAHRHRNGFHLPTETEWEWISKHHTRHLDSSSTN